jgi:SAM-dependent methyltransferase
MFFPDKDRSDREAHRVLAPGGRYLFSVWDSHRHNRFGRIAHEVVGSFFAADPPQFDQVPFGCHSIDPIKESLIDAGFTDIKVHVIALEKEISNAAAFARVWFMATHSSTKFGSAAAPILTRSSVP